MILTKNIDAKLASEIGVALRLVEESLKVQNLTNSGNGDAGRL